MIPLMSAGWVMVALWLILPRRRSLDRRLGPYAGLAHSRLGGTGSAPAGGAIVRWSRPRPQPLLARVAEALGLLVDRADAATLQRRLRQAGFGDVGVEHYRMRQLGFALGGLVVGAFGGVTLVGSSTGTVVLMALFGFPAATLQRSRIERRITARRVKLQADAPTIAQLIAVHVRSGAGPMEAVRSVCRRAQGPVVDELAEALGWISGGSSPQMAYDRLAEETPEPAASRLYRILAASARSGADAGRPLLAIAEDLRIQRRDELARAAVRRRTAMLAPLLLLIAPVMLLFVGAALPSMVLGSP